MLELGLLLLIIHFLYLEYWKSLASSATSLGKTLERHLDVIHCDIVTVWSFQDPHRVSGLCIITRLCNDKRA
jgi:hypothetical protein